MKTVWTIGHSNRSLEEFFRLLSINQIQCIVDVRRYAGSKHLPHFNKEDLFESLKNKGIDYHHLPGLGGRRQPKAGSKNSKWKNAAFRGYADYMESDEFLISIEVLMTLALQKNTAFMCSEAVWWSCHRSLISDFLKINDWKVLHILNESVPKEHPYTTAARIENGKLFYNDPELSF